MIRPAGATEPGVIMAPFGPSPPAAPVSRGTITRADVPELRFVAAARLGQGNRAALQGVAISSARRAHPASAALTAPPRRSRSHGAVGDVARLGGVGMMVVQIGDDAPAGCPATRCTVAVRRIEYPPILPALARILAEGRLLPRTRGVLISARSSCPRALRRFEAGQLAEGRVNVYELDEALPSSCRRFSWPGTRIISAARAAFSKWCACTTYPARRGASRGRPRGSRPCSGAGRACQLREHAATCASM